MPALTDVPGLRVGHVHDAAAQTGCTVILAPDGCVGGVDVCGGAPGTRETDLLDPTATVSVVHAIALCGGSAFGLAAATGVMQWLAERGIGFPTAARPVPIVPAAVIYDLAVGRPEFPDAAMGYAACAAAAASFGEGRVGAGIGATVGKLAGVAAAMPGGVGTWSEILADGTVVAALAVTNAVGDVVDAAGRILAGARGPDGAFVDSMLLLRSPQVQAGFAALLGQNTTLAVVATNARLTKAETTKLAQMAHDGLARSIRPCHTPLDGDTVFALATGSRPLVHLAVLGSIAADVLSRAVERSVRSSVHR